MNLSDGGLIGCGAIFGISVTLVVSVSVAIFTRGYNVSDFVASVASVYYIT